MAQRFNLARELLRKDAGGAGGASTATPAQLAAEIKRIGDETKTFAEKAITEIKANGSLSTETKQAVDRLLIEKTAITERLTALEKAFVVMKPGDQAERLKTIGEQVIESELFKKFRESNGSRVSIAVKALLSSGFSVQPDRRPGIIAPPQMRLTVRDLIAPGRTSSNAIEFMRETLFTNNAGIVATENTLKPESDITFDLQTRSVATIAHWVIASKQILDDAPALQSYIDGRLRHGLALVEELQLLKGSGTGGNLQGIYTAATAYLAPAGAVIAAATRIDILRIALLQAELAGYPANGIVLHPTDWALIETLKTSEGAYLFANPQNDTEARLWGRRVIATIAMTQDTFLVGAFGLAAQIFDREDANVVISTEDRDNFVKNMVTIRAEERLALAVYRPQAFIKGDLTPA